MEVSKVKTINQFHQDSTTGNFPTTSGVVANYGFNVNGGPLSSLDLRFDMTFGADPTSAELWSLIDSLRVVLNSEVVYSWTSAGGAMGNDYNGPCAFAYFLNSMGGVATELPSGTTTREGYLSIPIGRVLSDAQNRVEVSLTYSATAASATPSSGKLSFFGVYNTDLQNTTVVAPATSYAHTANAIEQVVIKTGGYNGMVVSGIFIQNDTAADEYGQNGLRVVGLGAFGLEVQHWRQINGDLNNTILYADNDASTTQQSVAFEVKGGLWIPTMGLAGADITLIIDSSSNTTRFYTPTLTAPVGSGSLKEAKQTQSVGGGSVKKILSKIE
jgi:hypothetical protein